MIANVIYQIIMNTIKLDKITMWKWRRMAGKEIRLVRLENWVVSRYMISTISSIEIINTYSKIPISAKGNQMRLRKESLKLFSKLLPLI